MLSTRLKIPYNLSFISYFNARTDILQRFYLNRSNYRTLSPISFSYRSNLSEPSPSPRSTLNNDINFKLFSFTQTRGPKIVRPRDFIKFWKIRTGDKVRLSVHNVKQVVVISGKDKGKTGEVLMCDRLRNQVKVKGCNMRKLMVNNELVQIEKKIHYSNVQLIDELLNVGTRVAIRYSEDNKPLRVSKKSGLVIPWPKKNKVERGTWQVSKALELTEGEKDTSPEEALKRTYDYHKDIESMNLLRQTMYKYNRDIS